jgi:hypothetical protein
MPTFLRISRIAPALALTLAALASTAHGAEAADGFKVFSGEPRLLVAHGYSTSFHWWAFLQRKIDRLRAGDRKIEVNLVAKGGTPIAKWIDVNTGEPLTPWSQRVTSALSMKRDRPAVVLAQQSLQWVFGAREVGIVDSKDTERIGKGADAIEKYVRLLRRDGADHVFVAMHIYKQPMEPVVGNERLALAEAVARGSVKVHAGPDVWEPTSKLWPKAFAEDKLHPNSIGAEVMAQLWFETLLKHDGLEVPAWSRQEMEIAIQREPLALGTDRNLFGRLLETWNILPGAQAPWRKH